MPLPPVPAPPPPPTTAAGLQPFLQAGSQYYQQTGNLATQSALSNYNLSQQGNQLQRGYLQGTAQDQLAQLGIQGADLGIQQGANARQGPLATALFGLQNQSFDVQAGGINRQLSEDPVLHQLSLQDIQAQQAALQQQRGAEQYGWEQQNIDLSGQAGVSGMSGGRGSNQPWMQARLQHEMQAGGPDLGFYFGTDKFNKKGIQAGNQQGIFQGQHYQEGSFARQAQSLDRSTQRENINFDLTMQGLQDQIKQLDIKRQESTLGYNEQMAQIRDRSMTLDNMSKSLGISRDEIMRRLNYGIQSLGLADQQSANSVVDQLVSIGQNQQGQMDNMTQMILQAGGL